MHLFHYHLVTSRVREVEARYIGKLGFDLVARHGRIGEDLTSFEPGVSWTELDEMGFKLRLSELELGSVNVVVQPGQWPLPRVDHLGLALDEDEFERAIARADEAELRVQEHGGRRTFVSTAAGYRLELHPPRDWIDELLEGVGELRLAELHLLADNPEQKAIALAEVLDVERIDATVWLDETVVKFLPGRGDRRDARPLRAGRPAGTPGAARRAVHLGRGKAGHTVFPPALSRCQTRNAAAQQFPWATGVRPVTGGHDLVSDTVSSVSASIPAGS